jgi:hypothetical protein
VKKKIVWATVLILTVVSAFALVAYADPLVLRPVGRIRVSLEGSKGSGNGSFKATWNPFVQVWDGSFSAELGFTSDPAGGDEFAAVIISPLSIPLSTLKTLGAGGITFWVYHYDNVNMHPIVDMILDNGRWMEGVGSVTVAAGATINSETGQGYPSADWWIQMKPVDGWFSSFAAADPAIPDGWNSAGAAATLAQWSTQFPTARIVQLRISYGFCGMFAAAVCNPVASDAGLVYLDTVVFVGRAIPIEPEGVNMDTHYV